MLRRTRPAARKAGGGSGVMIGIGLAFAVFDPRAAQAIEIVDQKQDENEDGESGDEP